jgi:oligoendopeptidase F
MLMKMKGYISKNESMMIEVFKLENEINKKISKLDIYARLKYIKNNEEEKIILLREKNKKIFFKLSFIRPELLSLPDEILERYRERASMK